MQSRVWDRAAEHVERTAGAGGERGSESRNKKMLAHHRWPWGRWGWWCFVSSWRRTGSASTPVGRAPASSSSRPRSWPPPRRCRRASRAPRTGAPRAPLPGAATLPSGSGAPRRRASSGRRKAPPLPPQHRPSAAAAPTTRARGKKPCQDRSSPALLLLLLLLLLQWSEQV